MLFSSLLAFAFIIDTASAFLLFPDRLDKWNDLKVHWGANPISSDNFAHMPRTVKEAKDAGFKKISDCDAKGKFRGARYVQNGDYSVVLLFDINGYIAGMQTAVPTNQADGYPKASIQPPFVEDGDRYFLTAYFVRPSTICSTGRNAALYESEGTGDSLYIQNGTDPEKHNIDVPTDEPSLLTTMWTKGKCFRSMGTHYWYNTYSDMSCDEFLPFFLLFNNNVLTGFGWAMGTDLNSKRLEHPPHLVLPLFFNDVPKCLYNYKTLSTMHIYFRNSYFDNFHC